MRIAILTRDNYLFESIKVAFDEDGIFTYVRFVDEISVLRYLAREAVDLVILDSGERFSRQNTVLAWRNCRCLDTLPVLVIGRFATKDVMTAAFDAGADDFVAGNLSAEELLVRTKHAIKRSKFEAKPVSRIELASFLLDNSTAIVRRHGRVIRLTSREFSIAWLFFSNPGKLLTRAQIAHIIWGKDLSVVERTLEQHVYKLRSKLDIGTSNGSLHLSTAYSLGYKLEITSEPMGIRSDANQRTA